MQTKRKAILLFLFIIALQAQAFTPVQSCGSSSGSSKEAPAARSGRLDSCYENDKK
jgi:hypothetical protein